MVGDPRFRHRDPEVPHYGDWVGETEIADFEAANPGIEIEQFALPDGGSSALAAQLAKDKGVYDLVAVGNATAARLEAGNLLADFDPASVPNLANCRRSTATSSRGASDRPRQGRDHLRQGEGPESAGLVEGVVRQRLPMDGQDRAAGLRPRRPGDRAPRPRLRHQHHRQR
ncbi:extracellular solute-binding protein [Rhodococcus hoagii]|nr:extracellular solute-binding protein [Prescottella equi]